MKINESLKQNESNANHLPSLRMHLKSPCLITSPGMVEISSCLSSRVVITFWKPQSASVRVSVSLVRRFRLETRLNRACVFSSSTTIISPGSMFGAQSPSPQNVIFWPSVIPLSMCTSRISFFDT